MATTMTRKTPFLLALLLSLTAFGQTQTIDWTKIRNRPTTVPGYGIVLPNSTVPCRYSTGTGLAQNCTLGSGLTVDPATGVIAVTAGGVGTVTSIECGTGLTGGTITTAGVCAANFGATAGTIAQGNDARLSDTRTPTDGSVTNAKVAAGAAIARSKLAIVDDDLPGNASLRTLGTGAQQAAPGNTSVQKGSVTASGLTTTGPVVLGKATAGSGPLEAIPLGAGVSFSGGQLVATGGSTGGGTPADGSVRDLQVASDAAIAESKLALVTDAAAGVGSRRTLGTGALQAAPGASSVQKVAITTGGQTMASARILGRTTAGVGPIEELVIGSGLTTVGSELRATAAASSDADVVASLPTDGTTNIASLVQAHIIARAAANPTGFALAVIPVGKYRMSWQPDIAALKAAGVTGFEIVGKSKKGTQLVHNSDEPLVLLDNRAGAGAPLSVTAVTIANWNPPDSGTATGRIHRLTIPGHTYVANDLVTLTSSIPATFNPNARVGETFRVRSVSGDFVWVDGLLSYRDEYAPLTGLVARKLDKSFRADMYNFTIRPSSDAQTSNPATRVFSFIYRAMTRSGFDNLVFDTSWGGAIRLETSADIFSGAGMEWVDALNRPATLTTDQIPYTIQMYGATFNVLVQGGYSIGWRHAPTTDGLGSVPSGSTLWTSLGAPFHWYVMNFRASNSKGAPYDTHPEGGDGYFINCISEDSHGADTSGFTGGDVQNRARRITIVNLIGRGSNTGITWKKWNHGPDDWLRVINTQLGEYTGPSDASRGISVLNDSDSTTLTNRFKLILENVQIQGAGQSVDLQSPLVDMEFHNLSSIRPRRAHINLGQSGATMAGSDLFFNSDSFGQYASEDGNRVLSGIAMVGGTTARIIGMTHRLGTDTARHTPAIFNATSGPANIELTDYREIDPSGIGARPIYASGQAANFTVLRLAQGYVRGLGLDDSDKTLLTLGAVADGQVLKRVGSQILGADATGGSAPAGNRRNVLAVDGDSIPASSYKATGTIGDFSAKGYVTWFQYYTGQAFYHTESLNFAVSGSSTADMVTRMPAVIASGADNVLLNGGTNDIKSPSRTVAAITSDLNALYQGYGAAGIRVIAVPILPRSFWDALTGDATAIALARAKLNAVNNYIRTYNLSNPTYKIIVADATKYLTDFSTANGDPITGYTEEGLHPGPVGGRAVGFAIAESMQPYLPAPMYLQNSTPSDIYDATTNTLGNLLANGFFIGTGGSTGSGTSGAVSANWGLSRSAGSTITASASKVTVGTESIQRIAFATNSTGVESEKIQIIASNITAGYATGDVLQATCTMSGGLNSGNNLWGIGLRFNTVGTTVLTRYGLGASAWPGTGSRAPYLFPSQKFSGVVTTPTLTVPSGTTAIQLRLEIEMKAADTVGGDLSGTGNGDVDLSRCSVRKVN